MKRFYWLDYTPFEKNMASLRLDIEKLPFPNGTKGSYNILAARLLNLSYAQYLRYCRDELGAKIVGKQGYSYPYFYDNDTTQQFVKLLNARLTYIMKEQEDPFEYVKKEDGEIEKFLS